MVSDTDTCVHSLHEQCYGARSPPSPDVLGKRFHFAGLRFGGSSFSGDFGPSTEAGLRHDREYVLHLRVTNPESTPSGSRQLSTAVDGAEVRAGSS